VAVPCATGRVVRVRRFAPFNGRTKDGENAGNVAFGAPVLLIRSA
jgi:hypothetical protein